MPALRGTPHRRPSAALIVAVIALILALGGVAIATIPSSDGTIHGCYNDAGSLRVIDAQGGATCSGTETPLVWSQQGPSGPTGPVGPTGAIGPVGASGPPGPAGPATAPLVITGAKTGATELPFQATRPLATMVLHGRYAVVAKLWVSADTAPHPRWVACRMFGVNPAVNDRVAGRLESGSESATRAAFTMTLAGVFPARVAIECTADGAHTFSGTSKVYAHDIRFTAIGASKVVQATVR